MPSTKVIEYAISGGPDLGSGIHEQEMKLVVDLGKGTLELWQHAPGSDEGGEAIGFFKGPLDSTLATRLNREAIPTALDSLGGGGGGPGTSILRIRIREGAIAKDGVFASRNSTALEKLEALLEGLNQAVSSAEGHPVQALGLVLHGPGPDSKGVFEFALRNLGTSPAAVADPTASTQGTVEAGIRVARLPDPKPGYTSPPLKWTTISYVGRDRARPPASRLLGPGEELVLKTDAWPGHRTAGRYLVQAIFSSYEGPSAFQNAPVLKGRILSESEEFTVP